MKLYEYVISLKDDFSGKMQKLMTAAGVSETKVGNLKKRLDATSSSASGMGNAFSGLGGTIATVFTVGAIAAFATGFVKAGAELEQTRISYQTMVGDVAKGNKLLNEMNDLANVTPFENKDILQAGQTLLNFGIEAEKVKPVLSQIGDVASGNAEKMKGLSLAFAQVSSAGKLQGQDLLQMINQGFNPLRQISQDTGISMSVLKDKMEKGAISAQMVEQAFKSATSEGGMFYKMSEKQSKTLGGEWSTLMGDLQTKIANFSARLSPLIAGLVHMADVLLNNTAVVKGFLTAIGIATGMFLAYKAVVLVSTIYTAGYTAAITIGRLATILFTGGFAKLNLVMQLNPFALIVTAIVAFIGILLVAYQKIDFVRGAIWGLFEAGKQVFQTLWETAKQYLGGLADLLVGVFTMDIDKIKKGLSSVGGSLKTAYTGLGKGVAEKFQTGYNDGVKNGKFNLPDFLNPEAKTDAIAKSAGTNTPKDLSAYADLSKSSEKEKKSKTKTGVDSISAGGTKSINIRFDNVKFADKVEIMAQTMDGAVDDLEMKFKQMFARVLNGSMMVVDQ